LIDTFLTAALVILAISALGCLYRLLKGPSVPDRVAALDSIGILLISITALVCVLFRTTAYLDIVLVIGILSFIGTTAFARFIERGEVIEYGDDRTGR